jgi:hypothetical protein
MTVIACGVAASAAQIVRPTKDGTLADGSPYGPFDGFSDDEDWYFNESGYEGSINLITVDPDSSLEYRVVWEYNLAAVSIDPPVSAMLNFTVRGAPIWPFPDVDVHVYSYPSDLLETPADVAALLPASLVTPFTTSDLAAAIAQPRRLAQRMAGLQVFPHNPDREEMFWNRARPTN